MADQIVVLGDGNRNAVGVDFLEGVGADHRGRNLTGDTHQRDGIQSRIGNSRHQIGGPRPATGHTHGRFAIGSRHALGDKPRALFVTRQDMTDLRTLA
ncbi:hypothetical protein D3C73_948050 [compost metagenome]